MISNEGPRKTRLVSANETVKISNDDGSFFGALAKINSRKSQKTYARTGAPKHIEMRERKVERNLPSPSPDQYDLAGNHNKTNKLAIKHESEKRFKFAKISDDIQQKLQEHKRKRENGEYLPTPSAEETVTLENVDISGVFCPFCGERIPEDNDIPKHKPSVVERFDFCQKHRNRFIIDDALCKGYPRCVDFSKLSDRTRRLVGKLEELIENERVLDKPPPKKKDRKNKINKAVGDNKSDESSEDMKMSELKASQPMRLFGTDFNQKTIPGYYGPKGARIIGETLQAASE